MGAIIDGLLKLARAARTEPAKQETDLAPRVRTMLADLLQTDPTRAVDVVVPQTLNARCDPALVEIVLDNLLRNAWKFTSKRSQARIEVGVVDSQKAPPVYFIRDDGAGFEMAQSGKLFGAFQRLHAESEFSGIGIGLATVQRIIQRHGGRIWAEGAVDRGATFFFTLEPERSTITSVARNH
jgi:light-regulated signal transduction histidine kinase (bacteriophytochrome)